MNKKTPSESDICNKFIRPAIEAAGWDGMSQIYREYPLRAGRVIVRGRKARRDVTTVLCADHALFVKTKLPKLNEEALKRFVITVPPREEQLRIVARVIELRHLCADLRLRLARCSAMQAVLADH